MAKTLYIVVPCYNEQEVFPETKRRLCEKLAALIAENKISERSRVFFVNDGSKDTTWKLIAEAFESEPLVCGMSLSRNRGHQNVLLAGLLSAVVILSLCRPSCRWWQGQIITELTLREESVTVR